MSKVQPVWMYAFRWHQRMVSGRVRFDYIGPLVIWITVVAITVLEVLS